MHKKSILVIFGNNLPKKSGKWYERFDEVIAPKSVGVRLQHNSLERFIEPGSLPEAYRLISWLPNLTAANSKKVSKLVNYRGYDLWWMHFDGMYYRFVLPFTQYKKLLAYLKDFETVCLFEPPHPELFRYFLKAHSRSCLILKSLKLGRLLPLPFGVFLQVLLSIAFLPWLIIVRHRLMIWIGDKLEPSRDYDFRMKFFYEELRKRKIPFVEFARSLERWPVVLEHAWRRKRPVIYSGAIIELVYFLGGLFKRDKKIDSLCACPDSEKHFWLLVATHGFRNIRGNILAIRIIKIILRLVGVRIANITAAIGRTLHEVLACKLNGIKTIGIEHGAISKYYMVSDFMPGFDGEKKLSVDEYGLWSSWWRDYYIKNSDAYKPEQLFVSGPVRPLEAKEKYVKRGGKIRVLYISEEVASSKEVLPYILTLLETGEFELHFKFRPYRDGLELELKEDYPEVYKKILQNTEIFRGTMEDALNLCDVTVGSYSTAVLESLLQLKPFVFFLTEKWGDQFEIKASGLKPFFAESPRELIERVKNSPQVSKEEIRKLQERFFGNPYQNGSKWLAGRLQQNLKPFE